MKPKACLYVPTSSRRPGRFKVSDATDSAAGRLVPSPAWTGTSRVTSGADAKQKRKPPIITTFQVVGYFERETAERRTGSELGALGQRWLHGWPPPRLRSRGPPPDLGSEPGVQAQTLALRSACRRPLLLADCVFIQIPKTHTSRSRPSNRMNPTNETHPS